MAKKGIAVLGIYKDYASVETAVDVLKEGGFRNTDISVIFPQKAGSKQFAHDKGTRAPEGAVAGAGTGALLGGTLGWLVGIGALAIPGLGPVIAAGPLMGALAGAGVGGAVGGIAGALIGLGIPEHEAKRYEIRVKEGGVLLSVHSDDPEWAKRAGEILERTGARDISSTGEAAVNYVRSSNGPHAGPLEVGAPDPAARREDPELARARDHQEKEVLRDRAELESTTRGEMDAADRTSRSDS
jgi:hypothetical protein